MAGESRALRRLETLERGNEGTEEIRYSFDEFLPDNGTPSKYISVRKWFKGTDGEWHPTRAGVTIRLAELDRVVAALQRVQRARDAKNGSLPVAQTPPQRRPAEHRERNASDQDLDLDRRTF